MSQHFALLLQLGNKYRGADIQRWPSCLELLLVSWWHKLHLCWAGQRLYHDIRFETHKVSRPGTSPSEVQVWHLDFSFLSTSLI